MGSALAEETSNHDAAKRQPTSVAWYRTPLAKDTLIELHQRHDRPAWLQSLGYLGILILTGSLAFYSFGHWPWYVTVLLTFLHGTGFAFQINAVHELGHGTVFQTRALNERFCEVFAFLGWINHRHFDLSHTRHHRYTLHPPDDLEVVLPIKLMRKDFLQTGFVNLRDVWGSIKGHLRLARGRFGGEWEDTILPQTAPEKRQRVKQWSQIVLVGHAAIIVGAITASVVFRDHWWYLVVLISLAKNYGGWLFWLCNNTQHIGLQDHVGDFRLCCRTFTLNPLTQFLYWHMNYHIEHHMYAAVPCYKLGRLHRLIQHDLPPCPAGIVATWKEIAAIQRRQETDPAFQYVQPLPGRGSAG